MTTGKRKSFGSGIEKYFILHYNDKTGQFRFYEEKIGVIEEELFRGDKSYLGDKSMRTYGGESTDSKIFVEFVALIIRR